MRFKYTGVRWLVWNTGASVWARLGLPPHAHYKYWKNRYDRTTTS